MGRKRIKRRPTSAWTSTDFHSVSELGTLRVPPEQAEEWLKGVSRLLCETPLLQDLADLEPAFLQEMTRIDWNARPVEALVKDLHVLGSIEEGIDTLLASTPYRTWPFPVGRITYLGNFLMHAHAALEDNLKEDLGCPQFAHWPPLRRALLPAARPLWFLLARDDILRTATARRAHSLLFVLTPANPRGGAHTGSTHSEQRQTDWFGNSIWSGCGVGLERQEDACDNETDNE